MESLGYTAESQTFALIVTAEPYYAVRIPSEVVMLENDRKKNTKGKFFRIRLQADVQDGIYDAGKSPRPHSGP